MWSYLLLITKREDVEIKHLNDSKPFIEYSVYMDDVYNNIDDYNPTRKKKNFDCASWHDCWYYG